MPHHEEATVIHSPLLSGSKTQQMPFASVVSGYVGTLKLLQRRLPVCSGEFLDQITAEGWSTEWKRIFKELL